MADNQTGKRPSGLPKHLPYEEEVELMSEVIDFFIHRLPHATGETIEHISQANLANDLVKRLEQMTDDDLADLGLHRDDIPEMAANLAGLFKIAHKASDKRG